VVPEVEYPSDGEEEEGEEEEEEVVEDQRGGGGSATNMSHLVDPDPDYPLIHRTARRSRGKRRTRRRSISSNLPSMTCHGENPGDRR
jgi:hypothetical protein